MLNKKLSCRRVTAQRFVLLNTLLSHSRSLKVIRHVTLLSRAQVPISMSLQLSVSRTASEIFSVKEWPDLETGAGVVQGH